MSGLISKKWDARFTSKAAALDFLSRQEELIPGSVSPEKLEFFRKAINDLDLSDFPAGKPEDAVAHDLIPIVHLSYERLCHNTDWQEPRDKWLGHRDIELAHVEAEPIIRGIFKRSSQ
jgi:hypothetical protein